MDPFERRPEQPMPLAEPAPTETLFVETPAVATLPTMADLDRLAGDLDRVDLTLAQLDDPTRTVDS